MCEKGITARRAAYWAAYGAGVAGLTLAVAIQAAPVKGAPAAPAVAASGQSTPGAGFSHIKSLGGIDEYRLDSNGLTVLLVPDHSAPVVTFEVTYQVGSRNEVTGTTGAHDVQG